jgi:arginine decarboxylase
MNIHISSGLGTGPTKMAAFDAALQRAGAANYNLIRLSSIIPGGTKIIEDEGAIKKLPGKWGDRLYVVMAEHRVDTPNVEAWAGIGWVQNEKTGEGLFVEHEGANEATVRRDIEHSMKALVESRSKEFGPLNMQVTGITCLHEPVCALVIAVYEAQGWSNGKGFIPKLK